MKKKLVGRDCVEEYICRESGKIHVDGTMILSPGAKDHLRNKGIAIVYGAKPEVVEEGMQAAEPEGAECGEEAAETGASEEDRLIVRVAEILRNDYGITDREQLISISGQVVEMIKTN